ncbi:MAG: hypothetical protein KIT09_13970 [Bryobacteraceae bacterium]|nr:hypothetical protein [Bryobacteraceae bacterium]
MHNLASHHDPVWARISLVVALGLLILLLLISIWNHAWLARRVRLERPRRDFATKVSALDRAAPVRAWTPACL